MSIYNIEQIKNENLSLKELYDTGFWYFIFGGQKEATAGGFNDLVAVSDIEGEAIGFANGFVNNNCHKWSHVLAMHEATLIMEVG